MPCIRRIIIILFLAAGVAACGKPKLSVTRIENPDQALAMQQELQAQHGLNSTNISVARFNLEGQLVEITSLLPVVVAKAGEGDPPAATLFLFNPERTGLILYSRDGVNGTGYRLDLLLTEWPEGKLVKFPILNEDGTLSVRQVKLVKVIAR